MEPEIVRGRFYKDQVSVKVYSWKLENGIVEAWWSPVNDKIVVLKQGRRKDSYQDFFWVYTSDAIVHILGDWRLCVRMFRSMIRDLCIVKEFLIISKDAQCPNKARVPVVLDQELSSRPMSGLHSFDLERGIKLNIRPSSQIGHSIEVVIDPMYSIFILSDNSILVLNEELVTNSLALAHLIPYSLYSSVFFDGLRIHSNELDLLEAMGAGMPWSWPREEGEAWAEEMVASRGI